MKTLRHACDNVSLVATTVSSYISCQNVNDCFQPWKDHGDYNENKSGSLVEGNPHMVSFGCA